ncbi:hypothetical protein CEP53_008734 [Fusarium sp. AF-6]|nr:hypothetical protein CEP53_008734 [Fusarium sp. AF-6]
MDEPVLTVPSPSAHRIMAGGSRGDKTQLWTAARCQRLLRQLQCRLVALRKLVDEAKQRTTSTRSKRPSTDDDTTRDRKRVRYTYGRRRSAPAQTKPSTAELCTPPRSVRTLGAMKIDRSSPGEGRVDFPTPLLRKFREQSTTSQPLPTKSESANPSSSSLVADLQSLRRIVPESQFRIYEAIFGWMNNLLRSTDPLSHITHPKSLLGMCLRKVPAALAAIEAWDEQIAEEEGTRFKWDSSRASTELYGQLEGFGATGLGWEPLKLVVRAHALSLLAGAVLEGLFEPPFVRLLAELCISLESSDEAARLVSSLDCPLAAPRSSSSTLVESNTVQPLGVIVKSLHSQRTFGAAFECLSSLVRTKKLSLGWLTSRAFQVVWTRGIEVLNSSSPAPSAIDFICTAIDQLMLHEGKKTTEKNPEEQTLMSVLAALTAAAWTLGTERCDTPGSQRKQGARRMLHVLECCVAQQQKRRGAFRSNGLFTLVLARFIATAMIDSDVINLTAKQQASQECARLLTAGNGTPSRWQYRQTLLMACFVAQYRGRACGLACHDVLSEICATVDGLGLPDWFHDGLRSDGAFVLAQKTKDLRDIAFAESLPAAGKGTLETTTMFSGWRWEEGIGEWVFPSPEPKIGGEPRQHQNKREARGQRGTDLHQDARGRVNGPRWNGPVHSNSAKYDRSSSVESDEDEDDDDKAGITDDEEHDTSVTTVMDMDGMEDSEDELGGCAQMEGCNGVKARLPARGIGIYTRDPRGSTNGGNKRSRSGGTTTVKVMKRMKRAGSTRARQGAGSEKLGRGRPEKQDENMHLPVGLDWDDDELGMP